MKKTPDIYQETSVDSDRRDFVKAAGITAIALGAISVTGSALAATAQEKSNLPVGADNFYKSDKVILEKVSFKTQYTIRVAGNLVSPKNLDRNSKARAIIVGHPMGAVKEQSSMLYAQKLAEQGFVTLAIDLPCWGESEGQQRNLVEKTFDSAFNTADKNRDLNF